ncbi:MAG TPA: hypothetical protein VGC54_12425 [Planctomycetota bacterium]
MPEAQMTRRKGELLDLLRRQEGMQRTSPHGPEPAAEPIRPSDPDALESAAGSDSPAEPVVQILRRFPVEDPVGAAVKPVRHRRPVRDDEQGESGAAGGAIQRLRESLAARGRAGLARTRRFGAKTRAAVAGRGPAGVSWLPIGLVLLLALPFVFWLAGQFGTAKGEGGLEAVERAGAVVPGRRGSGHFGVLAITYPDRKADLARQTGMRLLREGFADVKLLRVWGDPDPAVPAATAPTAWLELYVGDSERKDDPELVTLLGRIKALDLPTQPRDSDPPFATAYIKEKPREQATE